MGIALAQTAWGVAKPDALKAAGGDWVRTESGGELRFKAGTDSGSLDVSPMYAVKDQRYAVYWQMAGGKKQS
jgi:hypothetical protein